MEKCVKLKGFDEKLNLALEDAQNVRKLGAIMLLRDNVVMISLPKRGEPSNKCQFVSKSPTRHR